MRLPGCNLADQQVRIAKISTRTYIVQVRCAGEADFDLLRIRGGQRGGIDLGKVGPVHESRQVPQQPDVAGRSVVEHIRLRVRTPRIQLDRWPYVRIRQDGAKQAAQE